jgi:hypothetical protein
MRSAAILMIPLPDASPHPTIVFDCTIFISETEVVVDAVITVKVGSPENEDVCDAIIPDCARVIVVLEMTSIEYVVVIMPVELVGNLYELFDTVLDPELPEVSVEMTVVPLMTVTVETPDVADVLPLFKIGPADCDGNEEELPPVLVGLVKENRDDVVFVPFIVLVVDDRKTPLEAVKDEVVVFTKDVLFNRQEAGIVKQHGRPVYEDVLGSKTPV